MASCWFRAAYQLVQEKGSTNSEIHSSLNLDAWLYFPHNHNALMLLMLILMIMIPGNDTASAVEQSSTSNSRKRETCSMLSWNESVKEEEFGMSISE